MKTVGVIIGVLLVGSTLIAETTNADATRGRTHAVESLAQVERALLTQGTVSYLHAGVAQALGLDLAHGAITVFQREADVPQGGKVIAVTVREISGRKLIILASWTETEVHAYLTSTSGILQKAVRATRDEPAWTAIPVRQAQRQYVMEKQYWLAAAGTSSGGTRGGR